MSTPAMPAPNPKGTPRMLTRGFALGFIVDAARVRCAPVLLLLPCVSFIKRLTT
jgi:hypothetical protein